MDVELLEYIDFSYLKNAFGFRCYCDGSCHLQSRLNNLVHAPVFHCRSCSIEVILMVFLESKGTHCPSMVGEWFCHPVEDNNVTGCRWESLYVDLIVKFPAIGLQWKNLALRRNVVAYKVQRMQSILSILVCWRKSCYRLGFWSNCDCHQMSRDFADLIIENLEPMGISFIIPLSWERWLYGKSILSFEENATLEYVGLKVKIKQKKKKKKKTNKNR